jgi:hypothetical protein
MMEAQSPSDAAGTGSGSAGSASWGERNAGNTEVGISRWIKLKITISTRLGQISHEFG